MARTRKFRRRHAGRRRRKAFDPPERMTEGQWRDLIASYCKDNPGAEHLILAQYRRARERNIKEGRWKSTAVTSKTS